MMDDTTLVQQAKENSRDFIYLYDRYVARLYAYAVRELGDEAAAQDVVASSFEKALRQLGRLRQPERVRGWLYAIVRNEIRQYVRRQKWMTPLQEHIFSTVDVEQMVAQQVALNQVTKALQQLAQRDQEVLRLHFFEELSHNEIASVLQCSDRNVAVRLHRALQRLRQQVQRNRNEVAHDMAR